MLTCITSKKPKTKTKIILPNNKAAIHNNNKIYSLQHPLFQKKILSKTLLNNKPPNNATLDKTNNNKTNLHLINNNNNTSSNLVVTTTIVKITKQTKKFQLKM
jgi:hypothetical protein